MATATVRGGVERWIEVAARPGARKRRLRLPYSPFAKQQEFHCSPAKYRLFGGAAGPGKTKALLMEAILQANQFPNVDTLLLRRTFPELEQTLLHYLRRDVPRELYRSFHETKRVVTWWNGSTTRFGYCYSENDIYQYQSGEFLFIGIDELTHFTLRQWQFLTSRNRCPVPGSFSTMAGATNPGNVGHAWVKALWIDRRPPPGMEAPGQYVPEQYAFIFARVDDNPIYAGESDYAQSLRRLPDYFRRAFYEGDWSVEAGQYFDQFDASRSVVRAEAAGLEPWSPRWISIDWGFEHPAAAYWHASVPAQTEAEACLTGGPAGARRVVTYREFVGQHMGPRELARSIAERSLGRGGKRERLDAIYLSPDAFARRTDEATIAEQMGDAFAQAGLPRPAPADNDRVGGWMLLYEMLAAGEWLIADSCPELIRTLPELIRDPVNVEDVLKCAGDDTADAARYGLKSHASARTAERPFEERLAARVTSPDPTVRAIQSRKAQLDERNPSRPPFWRRRPRWFR